MANMVRSLVTVSGEDWERKYVVDTKWEPPLRAMEQLSGSFPDIEFAIIWAGESLDQTGEIQYKDGRESFWYYPEEDSDDARSIYDRIWRSVVNKKEVDKHEENCNEAAGSHERMFVYPKEWYELISRL